MDMDLKRSLPSKMQDIAPEYGLFDLIYPSFCRVYGFQSILSCGDVVECVSALLEVANGVRLDFGGDQFSVGSQQSSGGMSMNAAASSTLWNASHWNSSLGKGEADGEDDDGYGTGGASSDRENPTTNNNNAGDNAANALARSQEAAAIAAAKAKKREEAWWVRNFWMAYDSLGNE